MVKMAARAQSYNVRESRVPSRRESLQETRGRFWALDVAFPSKLVKEMQELKKLYQLRYDVYCTQKGFLDPAKYPDKLETDIFDQHSLHFGAFDTLGNALGTLRLIRNSDKGFPMLDHCEINVPDEILQKSGEISRLAVSKMIRKRRGDGEYGMVVEGGPIDEKPKVSLQHNRRRHRPAIVVGLYKNLYQESRKNGITHWLAVMEPGLVKLLKRFHFNFEAIGPEVDYYGPVRPYMVSLESIEDQVYNNSKPFYAAFVKGLPPELVKHPV